MEKIELKGWKAKRKVWPHPKLDWWIQLPSLRRYWRR